MQAKSKAEKVLENSKATAEKYKMRVQFERKKMSYQLNSRIKVESLKLKWTMGKGDIDREIRSEKMRAGFEERK